MVKVFLRSFAIQGAWNFENMQNIGFAYSLVPFLRDRKALVRHLSYFNTHPYMASPILGAVGRMEEEGAGEEEIGTTKRTLMGSFGAIGDAFFWGTMRPLSAIAAIIFTLFHWNLWGLVLFLILYNTPHLWLRWRGLVEGYTRGKGVIDYVEGLRLPVWTMRGRKLLLVLLSLLFVLFLRMAWVGGRPVLASAAGGFLLVLLASYLFEKGFGAAEVVYLYSVIFILGSMAI